MPPRAETGTKVDFSRTGIARYIQLASLFRRRIESGLWTPGQQIPTVDDLAAECGVARATIRQALGILEDEHLIERHRAKGTFVLERPRDQIWCEVATDWSGLLMSRRDAVIEIISDERGQQPAYVPHQIGELAPSYRRLRRRHSRLDAPFLLTDLYVDERVARRIPKKDLVSKTALRMISEIPACRSRMRARRSPSAPPTSRPPSGSTWRSMPRLPSCIARWWTAQVVSSSPAKASTAATRSAST